MHYKILFRFVAFLIIFLAVSMVAPLIAALFFKDGSSKPIILSIIVTALSGLLLWVATKSPEDIQLNHRDGIAIVTMGWVAAALFGTLPYLFSGTIQGFTNSYFESISGFTTTGASIVNDIEAMPEGILLWRSMTQWLGGMGIIVLSIAILPFLGVGGMQLYRAEIPSPVVDKLKPRISETAKLLWKVYLGITLTEVVLLFAGGMTAFDAICHAFCSMPTGGFSTRNASIAGYNSAYFDSVIVVFMLLAGINFSLHYKSLRGDLKIFGRDPECRVFLILVAILSIIVTLDIYGTVYDSFIKSFRYAIFQISSIITTTGFVTADFSKWPALSQIILVGCMFIGAMAGSTGGGMKTMRIMMLLKHAYKELFRIVHPHAITSLKLGGRPVSAEIMNSIWGFFVLYIGLFFVSTLIMAMLGLDIISAFASVAASIGNIGPGLGLVGPAQNFYNVPLVGKWVLIFCMLLGRLEIYTVLVLMTSEFWRK
jgi:trk system potassium uptake protein TrkH